MTSLQDLPRSLQLLRKAYDMCMQLLDSNSRVHFLNMMKIRLYMAKVFIETHEQSKAKQLLLDNIRDFQVTVYLLLSRDAGLYTGQPKASKSVLVTYRRSNSHVSL